MLSNKKTSPSEDSMVVPPHSLEAEQSVIGSIIIAPDAFEKICDLVTKEDFFTENHQTIYGAMCDMVANSQPIDVMTLTSHLKNKKLLEQAGGFVYLADIAKNTPTAANCDQYAKIVKEKSILRGLIAASYEIQEACFHPQGRDAKEILVSAENAVNNVAENTKEAQQDTSLAAATDKFLAKIELAYEGKSLTGISSGIPELDEMTGGWQDSELIVLAARPSMGKSTLAFNFADTASKQGKNVIIFSLEMPRDQVVLKMCAAEQKLSINSLRKPGDDKVGLTDEGFTSLTNFAGKIKTENRVLDIDDRSGLSVMDIRVALKRFERKNGPVDFVVVDYLQNMTGEGENQTQKVTQISNGLKSIAKEFECPVLALAQLNRELEKRADKRPINSDLRDSGAIEQDGDVIMFVYRDEVYNEKTTDRGLAEIILGKQRNGPLGTVYTAFEGHFSRFTPTDRVGTSHMPKPKRYSDKGGFKG